MYGIVVIVIILLTAFWAIRRASKWRWVTPNGVHHWAVIRDLPDSDAAARLIGRVHARVIAFLRRLRDEYGIDATDDVVASFTPVRVSPAAVQVVSQSPPGQVKAAGESAAEVARAQAAEIARRRRACIDALLNGYNFEHVYENDPRWSGTSYTIAKGSALYLCVREKTAPYKLVDEETLYFVALHELAHIANYDDVGHSDKFWAVFKMLLHEAHRLGHYSPRDYTRYPVVYCGLRITYNPFYDESLARM